MDTKIELLDMAKRLGYQVSVELVTFESNGLKYITRRIVLEKDAE